MKDTSFINNCLAGLENENFKGKDYPVLISILLKFRGGSQQYCWCPECKEFHLHGEGNGHRVAHCYEGKSKYRRTGYCLSPSGYVFKDDRCPQKCSKLFKKNPDINVAIQEGWILPV